MSMTQFNRQGRSMSDTMRLKAFLRDCPPKQQTWHSEEYKGYQIEGANGQWYRADDPRMFTSLSNAKLAVDTMLAIREEIKS